MNYTPQSITNHTDFSLLVFISQYNHLAFRIIYIRKKFFYMGVKKMYEKKNFNPLLLLIIIFITNLLNLKLINADEQVAFLNDHDVFSQHYHNNIEVIPCGITIGIRINTSGIIVLGTEKIKTTNGDFSPAEKLSPGDLILAANEKNLNTKEDLINTVEKNDYLNLKVKHNNKISDLNIKPIKNEKGKNKIGAWVRDSAQGIGTMTYYNPITNKFGALGHGITDIDTQQLMVVKSGDIRKADNLSVVKGEKGNPGEILGNIKCTKKIGDVKLNNECGIYGALDLTMISNNIPNEKMPIARKNEIHEGRAFIRSNIEDGIIKNYDAYVENVNKFCNDDSKGMIIRITDQNLLNKTNGIIQGMSGSPIIQDNKLIGAITHVFVNEPTRGYGIFIENMIKQETLI